MGTLGQDPMRRAVLAQGRKVGSGPVLDRSRDPSATPHLPNLRRLREAKPDRYMALLRRAWPDIRAALDSGHTLKHICGRLNADGISIGYPTFRTAVGRLRRERRSAARPLPPEASGMKRVDSKMASIRHAWPDIVAVLNAGHSLKRVCECLDADGVVVEYKTLRAYVSTLRREQNQRSMPIPDKPGSAPVPGPVVRVPPRPVPATSRPDLSNPMATAMEYLGRVRGFQNFTGEPPDPDKIF